MTPKDINTRLAWAGDHMSTKKDKWDETQYAIIDNSKKIMYLNAAARSHAARRKARGAYQGIISAQAVPGTVPRQCPVQCPVQCPLEKHNDLAFCHK